MGLTYLKARLKGHCSFVKNDIALNSLGAVQQHIGFMPLAAFAINDVLAEDYIS